MNNNLLFYLIKIRCFFQLKSNGDKLRYSLVKSLVTLFGLSMLITPYWQGKVVAKENSHSASATKSQVTFNPPEGYQPKSTSGGASRSIGQCLNQAENSTLPLAPVLPAAVKGLTVASHPTILAYLPKTSAQKVFFSWRDQQNNDHYQAIIPLEYQNEEGIISLTLPVDAPPLEIGKNYQWALALMCDGKLQPDSPIIQGQIERVEIESNLQERLKSANALETAAIYGEAGIWYETIATLAKLKTIQPNDSSLIANWQELLTSVGLEKIATTPLIRMAQ